MLHHLPSTLKQFLGRRISEIHWVSDHELHIMFADGTSSMLSVYGDCCSTSIFYEVVFPDECEESPIVDIAEQVEGDSEATAIEKVKVRYPDFSFEHNSVWDVVIRTEAGEIRIRHINSSNGYYDGCTQWTEPK